MVSGLVVGRASYGASVGRRGRSSGHRHFCKREGEYVGLQESQRCNSELRCQACLSA